MHAHMHTHRCVRTHTHTHRYTQHTHRHIHTHTHTTHHTPTNYNATQHTLYSLIRVKCLELKKQQQKMIYKFPTIIFIIITCVIIVFPAPSLASSARSRPRSA